MPTATTQPYHLAAGEGEPMSWFTAQFQRKASDTQIGLMELEGSPGVEPPLHVHRNEDEWYYLLDGEVTFHVGGENFEGRPGSLVFYPRAVPHTFSIRTASARMLLLKCAGRVRADVRARASHARGGRRGPRALRRPGRRAAPAAGS